MSTYQDLMGRAGELDQLALQWEDRDHPAEAAQLRERADALRDQAVGEMGPADRCGMALVGAGCVIGFGAVVQGIIWGLGSIGGAS